MAGVYGNNVFIIAEDKVVYVPTRDLAGKSKESVKNIITANVVKEVTELDIDTDTFVENLQENLGDVEQALSATIQETVSQCRARSVNWTYRASWAPWLTLPTTITNPACRKQS